MLGQIGYIGLGNMGGALAARLRLRHDLLVYDQDATAVRRLTEKGATPCAGPRDLAGRCGIIFLCLPTSDHVRAVIFGDDGLAGALKPGTLIVDQTSGDPNATRSMAAELARAGVSLIDAPVSGGQRGAEAGTIAIMVGAADDQFTRARPILTSISPNVFHAGAVGNGHVIKLVNNLLSGAQRLLTFEGVALAVKNGMEPGTAVQILLASGGRNAFLEKRMNPGVITGELASGFTLGLAHKDVRLACQLGADSALPMFFGNLTRELYQMCISEMGAAAEVDTAALVVDRLAGTRIVPPERSAE